MRLHTSTLSFFSSRRRHTRFKCDWSSDVCSSDLDLGYFYEKIRAGAFKKTITDGADVRALFNHDTAYVVGRVSNKTLSLREDAHGLYVEAIPPDTTWARDLVSSIKR